MFVKLLIAILLIASALGRVRRQEIIEETPIIPFLSQSRSGDGGELIEIQNKNAMKGVITTKDTEVEVLEHVDESDPTSNLDTGAGPVINEGRVYFNQDVVEPTPYLPVIGGRADTNKTVEQDKKADDMKNKKNTFWIIYGITLGIMLLFLFGCLFVKCRS